MNEARKSILLATATAEVITRMQSLINLDDVKIEGHTFVEMAATALGLPPSEGRKLYNNDLPEFNKRWLEWLTEKAQIELAAAVDEAEVEQKIHVYRVRDLRSQHTSAMQKLTECHRLVVPEETNDTFARLLNASHDSMLQLAERTFNDVMGFVQEQHRLILNQCFMGHLIEEATAKKLTELYEISQS